MSGKKYKYIFFQHVIKKNVCIWCFRLDEYFARCSMRESARVLCQFQKRFNVCTIIHTSTSRCRYFFFFFHWFCIHLGLLYCALFPLLFNSKLNLRLCLFTFIALPVLASHKTPHRKGIFLSLLRRDVVFDSRK